MKEERLVHPRLPSKRKTPQPRGLVGLKRCSQAVARREERPKEKTAL